MRYCNVDVDIDVFDRKQEILEAYSDKELYEELGRRRLEDDSVEKHKRSLELDFSIDLSDYYNEFIDHVYNHELISELEDLGYTVLEEGENLDFSFITKSKLAQWLGLRGWSTKKQILEELENIL